MRLSTIVRRETEVVMPWFRTLLNNAIENKTAQNDYNIRRNIDYIKEHISYRNANYYLNIYERSNEVSRNDK